MSYPGEDEEDWSAPGDDLPDDLVKSLADYGIIMALGQEVAELQRKVSELRGDFTRLERRVTKIE